MNIVLIGAGNLATNLGCALYNAGHRIVQVYSRTIASARQLADAINADATDDIHDIDINADIFIISVKDSVLQDVITNVTKDREKQLFVHTAGSIPMEIFRDKTMHYGVLYPLQTFSKKRRVEFSKIPVFIEANDAASLEKIRLLANSVSNNVKELSSDARKSLHLAAVFACNFTNHCYALSAEILERHGVSFDVMLPLIDETTRKVHEIHPNDAQTGPAVRYDENVISSHLRMLEYNPSAKDIYDRMSKNIHKKATEND